MNVHEDRERPSSSSDAPGDQQQLIPSRTTVPPSSADVNGTQASALELGEEDGTSLGKDVADVADVAEVQHEDSSLDLEQLLDDIVAFVVRFVVLRSSESSSRSS